MSRKLVRGGAIGVAIAACLLATPGIASAAAWTNINGTVYEGGSWFRSSTIRYKGGTGPIQIQLTTRPADSNGADWYINSTKSGNPRIGSQLQINDSNAKTLATGVLDSTAFQNNYKQHTAAKGVENYNVGGQEYY